MRRPSAVVLLGAGLMGLGVMGLGPAGLGPVGLGPSPARAEPAAPLPDAAAPAASLAGLPMIDFSTPSDEPASKATTQRDRAEARAPYLAMRDLERMQDRIAAGDTLAAAAHAKAINRAATAFAAAKPATWSEPRNARALVLYLFSGGNSGAIARAIPRPALPKPLRDLYEGALAYGLGDDDSARTLLAAIDPKTLPTGLGGHLALVQAALATEPAAAVERLDIARLLAPGTLVEEAALRKEIGLIDPRVGDLAKFSLLARRYAATFPRSVYRPNFKQLIRQAALAAAGTGGPAAGARLAVIVEALDARERHHLLLAIARDALTAGRMAMAATTAEQVLSEDQAMRKASAGRKGERAVSPEGERERARARVYLGAATIAGPGHDAARAALAAAAGAGLDGEDEALRAAALSVANTIDDPSFAAAPSRGGTDAAAIRDGERALGDAEAAMKVVTR